MTAFSCIVPASCKIIGFPSLFRNDGKVILGDRVLVNSLDYLYRSGHCGRTKFSTGNEGVIRIGDDSGINGVSIHAEKSVTIGKRVLIASGVTIIDTNGHPVDIVERRYLDRVDARPVTIEDDVWIAMGVSILPGVTIGKGSVIGIGSVVTKDIPPMVVAAGAPAKVVRSLTIS